MHNVIDDCEWLFLREINEPDENELRLIIDEAKAVGPPISIEPMPGRILTGKRRIDVDSTSRAFEVTWPSYIAYSVRNESYCAWDKYEEREGRLFCVFSKSRFLDYVAKATFADDQYPGPHRHWGINCLRHTIDVVSTDHPRVSMLDSPNHGDR